WGAGRIPDAILRDNIVAGAVLRRTWGARSSPSRHASAPRGHSWLAARDRWLASHKKVVRSSAVATRFRYDEGGMVVGWCHRCSWPRRQSLLEDRVTRNNVGRVGRRDDGRTGRIVPKVIVRAHRSAEPDPSAKRSETSDSERRCTHGLVIPAPRPADHGTRSRPRS